jgi:hypothetical protein
MSNGTRDRVDANPARRNRVRLPQRLSFLGIDSAIGCAELGLGPGLHIDQDHRVPCQSTSSVSPHPAGAGSCGRRGLIHAARESAELDERPARIGRMPIIPKLVEGAIEQRNHFMTLNSNSITFPRTM